MGFLDRIVAGAEFRASGLANPAGWLRDAFGITAASSGQRVSVDKALGLGPVYSAVSIISETIGMLPLKVYRMMDDDERVEARQHRTWRMLHDKPNEHTTAHRFWATVTSHLLLWGNCYLWKRRDIDGTVETLWLIDPMNVQIDWDRETMEKRFVIDGGRVKLNADDVLHIFGLSLNGITGESPISRCRESFGTALARSEFEGGFYRRGARLSGVLEHPGRIDRRQGKDGKSGPQRLADDFSAWHGGSANMHRIPVLEEGMTFKPTSMPMEDLQFLESQQLSRTDIATIFRLPPSYLGGSTGDSLTYATVESNSIQFAQLAIAPWTNTIAKALSSDPAILPQNVFYAEFVLEGLLRGDMKTRAEYWEKMQAMGVVDAAYIASRENFPAPPEAEPAPPVQAEDSVEPPLQLVPRESAAE